MKQSAGPAFDSLDAAERWTATAATKIRWDRLLKGDAREITIELRNEHRQRC
jgi:hypothetical protein